MEENRKPTVYIVIYTLYHHMYKLATKVAEGVEANGCQVKLFQVEETLSPEILEKMHAPAKPDLPIITASQLAEADGILFGLPTRFGSPPAQMKRLLDATGSLWAKGALSQKFAGFFFSTASSHGGQETTALTAVTYLVHQGINYVPFGFANASLFDNSKVIGGSAYGAGTLSNGDGSRVPIEEELEMAKNQGENFAKLLATYHQGMRKADPSEVEKEIHADNDMETTPVKTGTAAGAVAAAAGSAGLVAAGTKAARESDHAKQTDPVTQEQAEPTTKAPSSGDSRNQAPPTSSTQPPNQPLTAQQEQAVPPTQRVSKETQQPNEKKKKSKGFWFCCGNSKDLD
ncbi:flavoprotein-like protein [Chlamydoabsidia padenii]|nr:flavoprotein-like protein [Chlamydoabsidia padenii]